MKKMSLKVKLAVTTCVIGGLFAGGIYAAQAFTEKSVLAANEKDEEAKLIEDAQKQFEKIDNMSLKEYYVDYLNYDQQVLTDFSAKFEVNTDETKVKELSREEAQYLTALASYYENGEQPILARNEEMEGKEVVLNEKGDFSYSLETLSKDVAAMSSEIDSTTPIVEICEKYGIDPDGKIKDLTPEIILEIDQKMFEISDHPE